MAEIYSSCGSSDQSPEQYPAEVVRDLEMTKLCALAMWGSHGRLARQVVAYEVNDCAIIAPNAQGGESVWDPLHDDAQCFALMDFLAERGHLSFFSGVYLEYRPFALRWPKPLPFIAKDRAERRRAIVECVAKMQASESRPSKPADNAQVE